MKIDTNTTITNDFLAERLAVAYTQMAIAAQTPEPHWYPCGFAWASIQMRKNHRLARTLLTLGWRWNGYRKAFTYSMPLTAYKFSEMSQSMDYKARCLRAFAKSLNDDGIPCHVYTQID